MTHAAVIGDVLLSFAVMGGLGLLAYGFILIMASARADNPGASDHSASTGFKLMLIGIVVAFISICLLVR